MNVVCTLCPHNCDIPSEKQGICGVRKNKGDKIIDSSYGILSALGMDPIEKKPLYHFYPGKHILSAGFFGCNLKCPFCQNHSISQNNYSINSIKLKPAELVARAAEKGSFGIAYTYSEPLIHHEYLMDTSDLARQNGLKNVLITNGFINKSKGRELIEVLDAANIDLKCYTDDFYRKELKGKLKPVLDFIEMAAEKIHIEVTTLVIPGKNDSLKEISEIAAFLADLNPAIPYHLSAYYPSYKYLIPATKPAALLELVETAQKYLNFVFPGNVTEGNSNSLCPECGNLLIKRDGYNTQITGLKGQFCRNCGTKTTIIN
ncbi:MAG: AmmeMemoRadiSam system radical SAM enzyme [Spirochaetales bacterium]|nr:AmmeMemoRadiSam system radical SAM enzyme [Spirochaetales bacterium]